MAAWIAAHAWCIAVGALLASAMFAMGFHRGGMYGVREGQRALKEALQKSGHWPRG